MWHPAQLFEIWPIVAHVYINEMLEGFVPPWLFMMSLTNIYIRLLESILLSPG